jgi:hypothetical protein
VAVDITQERAADRQEMDEVSSVRHPWSVDRWGRLLAGLAVLPFATLGICHHALWMLGAVAVAGNLLVTSLIDRCPIRAVLIRFGAREREDLFYPGGRPRTAGELAAQSRQV